MSFTPVPAQTITDARTYAADANVRSKAGDYTVTGPEGTANNALVAALKASGVSSPMMEILDKLPGAVNFRTGA